MGILKYHLIFLALCLIVGVRGCDAKKTNQLYHTMPVSEHTLHGPFYVLGLSESSQPTMLMYSLGDSAQGKLLPNKNHTQETDDESTTQGPFLGDHKPAGGPYTFYLPRGKLESYTQAIMERDRSLRDRNVSAEIIRDDPKTRRQTVLLRLSGDLSDYRSVYQVDRVGPRPLGYSDSWADLYEKQRYGLRIFYYTFVPGELLLIVLPIILKKRKARPAPPAARTV